MLRTASCRGMAPTARARPTRQTAAFVARLGSQDGWSRNERARRDQRGVVWTRAEAPGRAAAAWTRGGGLDARQRSGRAQAVWTRAGGLDAQAVWTHRRPEPGPTTVRQALSRSDPDQRRNRLSRTPRPDVMAHWRSDRRVRLARQRADQYERGFTRRRDARAIGDVAGHLSDSARVPHRRSHRGRALTSKAGEAHLEEAAHRKSRVARAATHQSTRIKQRSA
jgi:hypothetical protein